MTSTSAPTRRPAPPSWSGANERRTAFLKYPCPISQAFIPDYPLFADQSSQSMLHTERWHPAGGFCAHHPATDTGRHNHARGAHDPSLKNILSIVLIFILVFVTHVHTTNIPCMQTLSL